MKVKSAAIKAKIVEMFAMLAMTGASLPGSNIRPPAPTVRDRKGCS